MTRLNTLIRLVVFTIVVALIIIAVQAGKFQIYLFNDIWYLLAFFFALSYVTSMLTEHGIKKDPKNFQIFYFGGMMFRVILCMIVALIIIYSGTENLFNFIINFFGLYLLFLGFEIYSLLTNLRANSKKST